MTEDEYRAHVKVLGLTPVKESFEGATIHIGRDQQFRRVLDPRVMTAEERPAYIALLTRRMGLTEN